jgi:GNAT superfamily N-acetyltransferase
MNWEHFWEFAAMENWYLMAGEGLKVPGYTEVSAVCTHPEHASKGYARILMTEVIGRIRDRGETPFLHVRKDDNEAGDSSCIRGWALADGRYRTWRCFGRIRLTENRGHEYQFLSTSGSRLRRPFRR